MTSFTDITKQSFTDLRQNKVLILPYLLGLGLFMAFMILVVLEVVVFVLLSETIEGINVILIGTGIFIGIIDLFIGFCIGIYIRAMSVGLMKEVVTQGKANGSNMFKYGTQYFRKLFVPRFIIIVMVLVILFLLGIATFIAYLVSPVFAIFIGAISLGLLLYVSYFLSIGLVFLEAHITDKNMSPRLYIRSCFNHARNNLRRLLCTYGTVTLTQFIIQLIVGITLAAIILPFDIAGLFVPALSSTGQVIETIIRVIINVMVGIFISLLIFRGYYTKEFDYGANGNFPVRLLAHHMDGLIWTPINIMFIGIGATIIFRIIGLGVPDFASVVPHLSFLLIVLGFWWLFRILYNTIPVSMYGATPGKRLIGMKVLHDDKHLSFLRALARYFAKYISTMVLFLGHIWILIDEQNQAWHDKICDTYVRYDESEPTEPQQVN